MAHTAITDPEMMKELLDSEEELKRKLDILTARIKKAKHLVIFTGAGISTGAGIPDFRGPDGVWTLKAKRVKRTGKTTSTLSAVPTVTHMTIQHFLTQGICKYLISQNCDGLHRRSGVPPSMISELHGNCNIEFCEDCGYEYLRDFHCYRIRDGKDHFTGRYCTIPKSTRHGSTYSSEACGGRLMNSTIDFGQDLPEQPLKKAFTNSEAADVFIVLGSSLLVSPACDMPKIVGKKKDGHLFICNLQKTPLDKYADEHIYAKCDDIMSGVMERLHIPVPTWNLHRLISLQIENGEFSTSLKIRGMERGTKGQIIPASIISKVELLLPKDHHSTRRDYVVVKEPLQFNIPLLSSSVSDGKEGEEESMIWTCSACTFENTKLHLSECEICSTPRSSKCGDEDTTDSISILSHLRIHFMGHYAEPTVDLKVDLGKSTTFKYIWLNFNPYKREWTITRSISLSKEEEEKGGGGGGDKTLEKILNDEEYDKIKENIEYGEVEEEDLIVAEYDWPKDWPEDFEEPDEEELTAETDKGGYIEPIDDCPHVERDDVKATPLTIGQAQEIVSSKCVNCKDTNENWLCMICRSVYCGRYINKHMISHKEETGHMVAMSLADLNTWCYECDSYIINDKCTALEQVLHFAKFGVEKPV